MNRWNLLTYRFGYRILVYMALTDLRSTWNPSDLLAEIDAVDRRLESFRAAIDEARRNGWRESDRVGADLEEYLAAVQVSQRDAHPRDARARDGRSANSWVG